MYLPFRNNQLNSIDIFLKQSTLTILTCLLPDTCTIFRTNEFLFGLKYVNAVFWAVILSGCDHFYMCFLYKITR